jgi:hypothetical protein
MAQACRVSAREVPASAIGGADAQAVVEELVLRRRIARASQTEARLAGPQALDAHLGPVRSRRTAWTAEELLAQDFPEPKWAVPGLIPEGLTVFCGAPKVGKSWFGLNLAVAVASGGLAFGKVAVERGGALYLALEDHPKRLQARLRIVLQGEPAPAALQVLTECEALDQGGADRIGLYLDRDPSTRVVIVDVFQRVRGRGSSNAYEADYTPAARLKAIADEFEVAVVVIHHTRKQEATDFLDLVSGTQGLAGAADAVAILSRSRGNADAVLKITGRDVDEAEYALKFTPEVGSWTLLDGPLHEHTAEPTRAAVLRFARQAAWFTPKQLVEPVGISHENAKKTCQRMADAGQLDTDGNGTYFLPVPRVPESPSSGIEGQGTAGTCEERADKAGT